MERKKNPNEALVATIYEYIRPNEWAYSGKRNATFFVFHSVTMNCMTPSTIFVSFSSNLGRHGK